MTVHNIHVFSCQRKQPVITSNTTTYETLTYILIHIAAEVILNATAAGFGVATGPVLIDEARCDGSETRLINCRHNGVGTLNCDHSKDVGLRCRIRKFFYNVYNIIQL